MIKKVFQDVILEDEPYTIERKSRQYGHHGFASNFFGKRLATIFVKDIKHLRGKAKIKHIMLADPSYGPSGMTR